MTLLTINFFVSMPQAYGQQNDEQDSIVVEAQVDPGLPAEATTTLKIPAPVQSMPLSLQVMPRDTIEDRRAQTVSQAIDTVSGVESSNAVPGSQSFRIRGFSDGNGNLRDGFRETSNQQDMEGIERIDVLKGPASVLYGGSLASGGMVNIITKTPVGTDFTHLSLTGGSRYFVRPAFDVNRDLSGDHSAELRIDGAFDRSDSFRQFGNSNNIFINPSLRLQLTEQDVLLIRAQYYRSDFSYGEYQSPIAKRTLSLPLAFSFSGPSQSRSRKNAGRISYDWTHTFDPGLKFRSGFNFSGVKYDFGTDRFAQLLLQPDGHTIKRVAQSGPQLIRDYDWQNEVSGAFVTGPLIHQWLAGFESYRSTNDAAGYQVALADLDLQNPVYDAPVKPGRLASSTKTSFDDYGGYFQDLISPSLQWHLLVGGRYDATKTKSINRLTDVGIRDTTSRFSPRLGLTYQPVSTTAFYTNWSNSFVPTTATSAAGAPLPPGISEQYEFGVKQQAFDSRLQMTLALYQLTRANVPTSDPTHALFSVASGKQRSRGVEFDTTGEILSGWKTTASYAYTFSSVVEDNRLPAGDRLAGVPRNAASIWSTYTFRPGSVLRGFGGGGGVHLESRREATLPNTFALPGYARFDAAIWYRFTADRHPFKFQVNLQNITNRRIYDTDGARMLRAQQPLTVVFGLSAEL